MQFMHQRIHSILLTMLLLFLVATLGFGELLHMYEKVWWWDDMLHTVAGLMLGLVGFLLVYLLNARYQMSISPMFVAVFAFSFAISASVLWEIVEFSIDTMFASNMQRWNLPQDAILIGKNYQGSGLRDTMSDLIVAWIGASIAAVISFFAYKYRRRASIELMKRTFTDKT